ncbi:glycosyltransferase family 2 protein [Dickeya chrysanthemi]|uniref:glycosyltransferase n=1 Tax=Dickeya chrysanthemi TaxID=556 RepID=UPI0025A0CABA|nr:glycosyltransferase family 2 protein [Dickeya chrysanthemi]WJM84525.1 glycosyltransferase family 2 protein [Dickeya chrysanthemi]
MLYISVVSHNSDALIIENDVLSKLAEDFTVVLKCNTPATAALVEYTQKSAITLLDQNYGLGFAQNNNFVFDYCCQKLNLSDSDQFLVLNPDVLIDKNELAKLYTIVQHDKPDICTINLFKDKDKLQVEDSIKKFPSLLTPCIAMFKKSRPDTYDKSKINAPICIDWAAGSFLLFQAGIYKKLNGFNEKFFMYFEDADICRRARKSGKKVTYYPNIKATHLGAYDNRKIFSKYFRWYLISYLRYHFIFS